MAKLTDQNSVAPSKTTRGVCLYLSVMRRIRLRGEANGAIAKALKIKSHNTIDRVTDGLWSLGLIHPSGWVKVKGSHYLQPTWRIGHGEAPPHPERGAVKPKRCPAIELIAFAAWWRELESPSSQRELMAASGMGSTSCRRLVTHARALREVHVADWSKPHINGDYAPMFMRGGSADKPKPAPMTNTETVRGQYHRRKNRRNVFAVQSAITGASLPLIGCWPRSVSTMND